MEKNKSFLGWIALDVDGTITLEKHSVPVPVVDYLRGLISDGWRLAIATGRPMHLALLGLKAFDFPHIILAQNGTIAMQMPSKKIMFRKYIPIERLREIEVAFDGTVGDFVVYNGYEKGDNIYWRPKRFGPDGAAYVQTISKKPIPINSFDEIREKMVPLIKCFGTLTEMRRVAKHLDSNEHFNMTLIRDPHIEDIYMLLLTDLEASKGQSLEYMIRLIGERKTVIAAGDDENDISLLKAADIKIAMAHAPETLRRYAHFIAPPTAELGIIQALQMAMKKNGS